MRGVDLSNLQGHPDTWPSQPWYWVYQEAIFVVVQAIEPPAGFPGHDFIDPETGRRGYTGVALRQARADGKLIGVYPWLWNGLADTYGNIMARLATVPPSLQPLDFRPWVDVEDTTGGPQGIVVTAAEYRVHRQLKCETRVEARGVVGSTVEQNVLDARRAADDWAASHGLPPSGGYSGDWYVSGYLGGWWPDGWLRWWAVYNNKPGSIIAGDIVMHQFTSTPVDQNEMLDSEVVSSEPTPTPEPGADQAWIDKKELVVSTLGYIQGDLVQRYRAEANRKFGPRRNVINEITDELARAVGDALA